ncbi:MAG TPA: serpin family protein [Polyangiaceae bacterium]|nr:serpin family protein [Polyangiaceae bacterium]
MGKTSRSLFVSLVVVAACGGGDAPGQSGATPGGSPASSGSPSSGTAMGSPSTVSPSIARAQSGTRDPASGIPASALAAAVTANNAFAASLYARVRARATDLNLVMSPLSASVALTMTYGGAKGDTATEMAAALHIDPSAGSIFDGQNALTSELSGRGAAAFARAQTDSNGDGSPAPLAANFELSIVDSVWGQDTYPWEPTFLDLVAKSYGTGVYLEDFSGQPDGARQAINTWVSGQTANKINDLLPPTAIDDTTRMVLVNAIHLKMPWATSFETSATAPGNFARADGTRVGASFMNENASLPYVDDGQAQIVALPLFGGVLSVVFALPHGDLATYEAGLGAGMISALAVPATSTDVQLSLPKVDFTSPSVSLKSALEDLGMHKAFDMNQADFSGLCSTLPEGPLYVNDVLQKVLLAFQEDGVEAAAASAVVVDVDGGVSPILSTATMTLNHPFLVSIVDQATGAVLFLGEIGDPSEMGTP